MSLHTDLNSFEIAEVNILEYLEERGSNIDLHFDDFWLWGERICGLNLL
jgi:alkylated DNA repair protein alkB family protein 4